MLTSAQALVLLRRHQVRTATLRTRTAATLAAAWDSLGTYDRSDVERFATLTQPARNGAHAAAVTQQVAFLSTLTGVPGSVDPTLLSVAGDPEAPFLAYWHALSQSRGYSEAVIVGRSVAEAEGSHVVASASRRTGDAYAEATGQEPLGYRRALDADACDWCVWVSAQTYRTAESGDFGHTHCGCEPLPIYDEFDLALEANRDRFDALDPDLARQFDSESRTRRGARTR
jgi:hypothetical protein